MKRAMDYFKKLDLQPSHWQDDEPYFSARTIGEWLEYPDPLGGINNILRRSAHLNDPNLSINVKLQATDGKKYNTRLFNFVGLQLIVFGSQQPKSIDFAIAVASVGWEAMKANPTGTNLVPAQPLNRGGL